MFSGLRLLVSRRCHYGISSKQFVTGKFPKWQCDVNLSGFVLSKWHFIFRSDHGLTPEFGLPFCIYTRLLLCVQVEPKVHSVVCSCHLAQSSCTSTTFGVPVKIYVVLFFIMKVPDTSHVLIVIPRE